MDLVGKVLRRLVLSAAASGVILAASPASAQGIIRDAEIEAILREYGEPLFEAAGLQPSDVNLYLVQDDSLNAGVGGGQNMFINTGLIMQCETPEQLKGVMAHEAGHIAGGHNVTRRQAMGAGGGVSLITMGLGALAIAAGAPDAAMALFASAGQFSTLTFFKYVRAEESAADQYGLDFLDKTHQSADGLVEFMQKFQYEQLMSEQKRQPYFQTHPISADRIQALRKRAQEITARAQPQSQRAIDQLAMMKAKLVGYLGPPARVAVRYPRTDLSLPAKYARAFAAYRAVDIKVAAREVDELIATDPAYPYFYELKGQILFESGKAAESIEPHRKSVEFAPREPFLHVNLGRSLLGVGTEGSLALAEGALTDALALERDNPYAWFFLAQVYGKQNKVPEADLATAEEAYYTGNMARAQVFARRAMAGLKPGTPDAQRADDIMALSDPRNMRPNARGGRSGLAINTKH